MQKITRERDGVGRCGTVSSSTAPGRRTVKDGEYIVHRPIVPVSAGRKCKKLRSARNCKNRRFGENHPGAVISDADVDLMRELHEEYPRGHPKHMGYRKLKEKFNLRSHGGHVARILRYEARANHLYD